MPERKFDEDHDAWYVEIEGYGRLYLQGVAIYSDSLLLKATAIEAIDTDRFNPGVSQVTTTSGGFVEVPVPVKTLLDALRALDVF